VSGILICVAVSAVRADEASKTAKVEEFFRISHTEEMLNQTLTMVLNQSKSGMMQQMMGVTQTQAQTDSTNELQTKMVAILANSMSWEKLKPIFVKAYADAFTEEELDGMLVFYKSPAGQALIVKTPSIMAKTMNLTQQIVASAMPEIQKLLKDYATQKK